MTVSISHVTQATAPNDPAKEVSSDAWNEAHAITGLGDAAEKNTGTAAGTVAAGDHLHTGVYEPAGVTAADITDSTATGRAVLTAADAAAARAATGSGTSSFSGAYGDLTGKPTLGTAAATAAADYATAAQGATASSALQPAGNGGSLTGLTKTQVGLANADNTSDAAKPVSTAQQTALDLKANLASPTFTGTVSGVTATMVGLGNVNNTSDAGKPISTATQTALDGKQASGTYATGTGSATGTNTGDNAVNTLYSGLAASKQDTLVSATNIKTINGSSVLGSGDLVVSGAQPEVLQSTKEPAAAVTVAANFSVFADEEMVIGDGFEFLLETNASLVII